MIEQKNRYCIIMAGGIGSRFWPVSRTAHPKQFMDVLGTGKSLLQLTYERFTRICPKEHIFIVTNDIYTNLVLQQLPGISSAQVLAEPMRRNTAPCIAYASARIAALNPDAVTVVAPSDHLIQKEDMFIENIERALGYTAANNVLVTLGIRPSRPDTGYGYIQFDEHQADPAYRVCKVKTFTEKPNLDMAKFFLQSGEFLWNSGIFIWNIQAILQAFENHLPEMSLLFNEGKGLYGTPEENGFIKSIYPKCPNVSIDYGIMEKAKNVYVLASDFGWSDLGTWNSLYEHVQKDERGNAIIKGNVMTYSTSGCIVNIPGNKLLVVDGLNDFIVIESDNVLMICKKDDEQQIKQFVNDVKIYKGERFI